MKKIISSVLAVSVVLGSLAGVGCNKAGFGGNNSTETVNSDKTQLYVSHFNGGYGDTWVKEMKKQFEEKYAEVSFESGKKGVQVMIDDHKNTGTNKSFDITADDAYVFFNENVPYKNFVETNKLMDITDIINGTFDINNVAGYEEVPDVEDKDILGKFSDLQKTALNMGTTTDVKYYAIPHYEGYYGFSYDAELFDKQGYYMFANGEFGAHSDDDGLSTGPDGKVGTYDDGLPNTYKDFFNLCSVITADSNIPMIFSGEYQFYITNAINALIADANGYNNETLYFTFNGTTDAYVTGFDANGNPTLGTKEITVQNGYDVFNQAGYYYGFSFLYDLINKENGSYLHGSCFTDGFSHTSAQNTYIMSARNSQPDIAMLADGIWWQNEAAGTFKQMETNFPNSSLKQRNFKFMPLPKATEEKVGEGATLLESQSSYIMVRKNMPEKFVPLAKLFVQFCNTTKALQDFTVLSNTPRALNYEMSETEMAKLTPFAKSVFEIKQAETTKIAYQLSTNALYADKMMTDFKKDKALAYGMYEYASKAMSDDSKLTAKTYFQGLANSWKNRWMDDYASYLK